MKKYYEDEFGGLSCDAFYGAVEGSYLYLAALAEVENGKAEITIYSPPIPSPGKIRDLALSGLAHDFGDGRLMQTRPRDEFNIRNAIEVMQATNTSSIKWRMADNYAYPITLEELKDAFASGQLKAMVLWGVFNESTQDGLSIVSAEVSE